MEQRLETAANSGEGIGRYPYDAIVVLPYTRRERNVDPTQVRDNIEQNLPGPRTTHRMSHFTSRAILAGWELFDQGKAGKFILPGEEKNPSTSELEANFLINNRHVDPNKIQVLSNLNGTVQQLDPVAKLQREGRLGKVLVVSFEFHKQRVEELMRRAGILGDIAEVEQVHADYLTDLNKKKNEERKTLGLEEKPIRVSRDQLIHLPAVEEVKRTEEGIVRKVLKLDAPFGDKAPVSRSLKVLTGTSITDLDHDKAVMRMARAEQVKKLLKRIKR